LVKFEPIKKKPGELIKSEDWNKVQEDVQEDLTKIEQELQILRDYINNMAKSVTLINMDSPTGKSYRLDEELPGEVGSYATSVLGYITRQWVSEKGKPGEICKFGILDFFDLFYYWSGAEGGEQPMLEIALEYVDGSSHVISDIFINESLELKVRNTKNPYMEYLLAPNEKVWYKYQVVNPNTDKEVRYISFKNTKAESAPRIANVIQHVARIRPVKR